MKSRWTEYTVSLSPIFRKSGSWSSIVREGIPGGCWQTMVEKVSLSLEWNSVCVMEGESGEYVEDECDVIRRVIRARLMEWDMKLIPPWVQL